LPSPSFHILGSRIDSVTSPDALAGIRRFLDSKTVHHVITGNTLMVLAAEKDRELREIKDNILRMGAMVEEQIRVAEGLDLSFGDETPQPRGWSMETRILAEDPAANFMPSVGRVDRVRFPHGPGVRVDGGFYRGYQIPIYYDSLLTKLVTLGRDR